MLNGLYRGWIPKKLSDKSRLTSLPRIGVKVACYYSTHKNGLKCSPGSWSWLCPSFMRTTTTRRQQMRPLRSVIFGIRSRKMSLPFRRSLNHWTRLSCSRRGGIWRILQLTDAGYLKKFRNVQLTFVQPHPYMKIKAIKNVIFVNYWLWSEES